MRNRNARTLPPKADDRITTLERAAAIEQSTIARARQMAAYARELEQQALERLTAIETELVQHNDRRPVA